MIFNHRNGDKGFTIIELIVVILVMAGLAVLTLNSMSNVQGSRRDDHRQHDIDTLYTQLEFYYQLGDVNTYPTLDNLKDKDWIKANIKALVELDSILVDPQGIRLGAKGSDYTYKTDDCDDDGCASYTLSAIQEIETPNPYVKKSVNK